MSLYFYPPGPTSFSQNTSLSYSATFIDEYPYGDYIVGTYSWSLLIQHGEGEYVAATGSTATIQSWQFTFGTLPYGYYWMRDGSGNVKGRVKVSGTDNDGITHTSYWNVSVSGVPYNTTSGTLSHNETWGDENVLAGSVVVPSGVTLKILPGAIIKFPANASLTINGLLNAAGILQSPITFVSTGGVAPGSWGNIYIDGSAANGSSISYANIRYGTQIQVINAPNVTIQNCVIDNVYYGIQYSGSTGSVINNTLTSSTAYHGIRIENSSTVTVSQNKVKKTSGNSGAGIIFSGGGSGYAAKNDVTGWNWGVGAIWGSSPYFYNASADGINNRITNCSNGVLVYNSSYPTVGVPTSNFYGNSIYNNTKNISLNMSGSTTSTLPAAQVWWGGTPVSSMFALGNGSSLYYVYDTYLTSDPWSGIPLPAVSEEGSGKEVIAGSEQNSEYLEGIILLGQGKKKEAKDIFLSYLKKNPTDQAAYAQLYNCYSEETADEITKYFESLPQEAAEEHKLLLSYLYLKQGKTILAKAVNDDISIRHNTKSLGVRGTLNNIYIALYNENDFEKAVSMFRQLSGKKNLVTPLDLSLAQIAIETYAQVHGKEKPVFPEISLIDEKLAQEVVTLQNYPNPFNPSTTITYNIPADGKATLQVYDVLGRLVSTLVNEYKTQGIYQASFDASRLPSGVYYYALQSGNKRDVKKMLLLK